MSRRNADQGRVYNVDSCRYTPPRRRSSPVPAAPRAFDPGYYVICSRCHRRKYPIAMHQDRQQLVCRDECESYAPNGMGREEDEG